MSSTTSASSASLTVTGTTSGSSALTLTSAPSSSLSSLSAVENPFTSSAVPGSTPTPGSGPGPGTGGGNGGGNGNGGGGGIATSAALYLYTFLATLVLLLSVSGAIILRSFILRRRHRRMIEEAIRNGTWIPPAPGSPGGGGRGAKVDLSKKPVIWDAWLGGGGLGEGGGLLKAGTTSMMVENARDWDSFKPVSAAYVSSEPTSAAGTTTPIQQTSALQLPTQTDTNPPRRSLRSRLPHPSVPRPRVVLSWLSAAINPSPVSTSPLPEPPTGVGNTTSAAAGGTNPNTSMADLSPPGPRVIRVAVMIAMPQPPSSTPTPHSQSPSSSSSIAHPLQASSHTQMTSQSQTLRDDDDDEKPLPHLELGVAEVLVIPEDYQDTEGDVVGLGVDAEGKRKKSMGSRYSEMSMSEV